MTKNAVIPFPTSDSGPETERTLSSDRLCEGCDSLLTNRRPHARYCSARCRTQAGRYARRRRVAAHLDTLTKGVNDLRAELGLGGEKMPSSGMEGS
jgi:hypothetical protein